MKTIITLFFAIICSSALGDELYAYVGMGQTMFTSPYINSGSQSNESSYQIQTGKRFSNYGIEIVRAQLVNTDSIKSSATELNGIRYWTLANYWYSYRVFIKAGVSSAVTSSSKYNLPATSKTGLLYAVGTESDIDENWRFRLEFSSVDVGIEGTHRVQNVTGSLGYAF